MYKNSVLSCLKELRDAKFMLASRAFKSYYETWCLGRNEESAIIRSGALKELRELFALEEWITSMGGGLDSACPSHRNGVPGRTGMPHAVELRERCRVVRLANQRLGERRGNGVAAALRTFLVQLAADEAGRVEAMLGKERVLGF